MRVRVSFFTKIIFILLLSGCNARTKQNLLKTFFDGVPGEKTAITQKTQALRVLEEKDEIQNNPVTEKTEAPPAFYRHPPFAEGACDSCHISKSSQKLQAEGKELCFSCHEDFLEGAKVKHYPAEEGMCVECHNPHRSPNKFMLKKTGQALCLDCHDKNDLSKVPPHDTLEDEDCTMCHNPHAGGEFLLE